MTGDSSYPIPHSLAFAVGIDGRGRTLCGRVGVRDRKPCPTDLPTAMKPERQSSGLTDRECIHATEVLSVLDSLSSTIIFNTATNEERLALAKRLRHWAVEDGTYLIREGDGDTSRSALFIIGEISLS